MPAPPSISTRPLGDWLDALARFSGPGPGVTRLAWDDAWCEAQRWLATQARALGLEVTVDAAGNLYMHDSAVRPGPGGPPVLLTGSHLDSVVHGGRLDGAYGAVVGVIVAAALRGATPVPVVAFACAEEEESRFRGSLLGARAALGELEAEALDGLTDRDGVTLRAALERARARGCAAALGPDARPFAPPFRAAAFLEPHIEQGPVLEAEGLAIGVVEHIAGQRRLRVTVTGEPRHAGTTPMDLRRDALAAGAAMVLAVEHLAEGVGAPAVATVGWIRPEPGLFNVVPGACELWIEMRHPDTGTLDSMERETLGRLAGIAERRHVAIAHERVTGQDPIPMTPALVELASALATELGVSHRRMTSGAGHDAMRFARAGVPTAMVFVPSRGGVSHSPDEHTDVAALEAGAAFTRELAARIAGALA